MYPAKEYKIASTICLHLALFKTAFLQIPHIVVYLYISTNTSSNQNIIITQRFIFSDYK